MSEPASGAEVDGEVEWVAAPGPLPGEGGLRAVVVRGLRLVLCRVGEVLHALEDCCPHAGVELSGGSLRGCVLQCPLHGGELDVRDGSPVTPPIRRRATTYPVRVRSGAIEIAVPVDG